ncbi:MAG: tetratricopeptide repeat protein [Prevotellaceae bacterium]|nr:tetratricopeptide repeat protein [Prevotellaceae bacterium]
MNEQTIETQYGQILSLLKQKRLKEAQASLDVLLQESDDWKLRNRLESARLSYRYMLQYMRQGTDDPARGKLHHQLLVETLEIADQARVSLLDDCSTTYYHTLRKKQKGKAPLDLAATLKTLETYKDDLVLFQFMDDDVKKLVSFLERHEKTTDALFLSVWTNSAWSVEEERQAGAYLTSPTLTDNDLCLFIGAVMLSLTACFDARKMAWLLESLSIERLDVNQRALTAVAFLFPLYHDRIPLYPTLTAQLARLKAEIDFVEDLNRVYIQLLRTRETESIAKKMREEFIPEMIKNIESLHDMKFGFDESDDDDKNPDWKIEEEMGRKMQEINDLQLEGADVYMGTLGQLKSFPFFQKLSNWFRPFDPNYSQVINSIRQKPAGVKVILALILQNELICNSDKYSLCFTTIQMNEEDSKAFAGQFDPEAMAQPPSHDDIRAERLTNMFIQDLYRFYQSHPRRAEFRDIFKDAYTPYSIPLIKDLLDNPRMVLEMADFLFSKGDYPQALELYTTLHEKRATNAVHFQKTGFCLQKAGRYQEAVEAYQKADILQPEHLWTLRHLAACYRLLHDYATAFDYYTEAILVAPKDRDLLFCAGSCQAGLGNYDKALKSFFELDFQANGGNPKVWRAIGWCSFISGKLGQARKYYDKLLAAKPQAADYLNAGHVAWCRGDVGLAAELYSLSLAAVGNRQAFFQLFLKDKETLLAHGIKEEDIPIMCDLIEGE